MLLTSWYYFSLSFKTTHSYKITCKNNFNLLLEFDVSYLANS